MGNAIENSPDPAQCVQRTGDVSKILLTNISLLFATVKEIVQLLTIVIHAQPCMGLFKCKGKCSHMMVAGLGNRQLERDLKKNLQDCQ